MKGNAKFGPKPIKVSLTPDAAKRLAHSMRGTDIWEEWELTLVSNCVSDRKNLAETFKLFPHRSFYAVKHVYYHYRSLQDVVPINCRQKEKRLTDFDARKDAIEGSAKLLQAMIDAGFVQPMKKAG
jgi:hypothetical protein